MQVAVCTYRPLVFFSLSRMLGDVLSPQRQCSRIPICYMSRKDSRLFLSPNEAVELLRLELFAMRFGKDSPFPSLQVQLQDIPVLLGTSQVTRYASFSLDIFCTLLLACGEGVQEALQRQ